MWRSMPVRVRKVASMEARLSLPQVSSDGQPHLLASHNLRAQLKRSLPSAEVRPLCLAGVPGGGLKGQLVALLAASTLPSSSGDSEQVIQSL